MHNDYEDNCFYRGYCHHGHGSRVVYIPAAITEEDKNRIIEEYLESKYKTWEVKDRLGNIHKVPAKAITTHDGNIVSFWRGKHRVAQFTDPVYAIEK